MSQIDVKEKAREHVLSKITNLMIKKKEYEKNSIFNIEEYDVDPLTLINMEIEMYLYIQNLFEYDR